MLLYGSRWTGLVWLISMLVLSALLSLAPRLPASPVLEIQVSALNPQTAYRYDWRTGVYAALPNQAISPKNPNPYRVLAERENNTLIRLLEDSRTGTQVEIGRYPLPSPLQNTVFWETDYETFWIASGSTEGSRLQQFESATGTLLLDYQLALPAVSVSKSPNSAWFILQSSSRAFRNVAVQATVLVDGLTGEIRQLTHPFVTDFDWSDNGEWLLTFYLDNTVPPDSIGLMWLNLRTGAEASLSMSAQGIRHDWLPDSVHVLVGVLYANQTPAREMLLVNLQTKEIQTLLQANMLLTPLWSEDSKRLLLIERTSPNRLYVTDIDNPQVQALALLPVGASSLIVSPDAQWLVFSTPHYESSQIERLNLNTGQHETILRLPIDVSALSWQE